jgi:acetolactate synthase II small subunit
MTAINLTLSLCEGALVRVLGVTERRGFPLVSVDAQPKPSESKLEVQLGVQSDRPVHLLINQLRKLHDVMTVEELK